jgi:hypothetical protein
MQTWEIGLTAAIALSAIASFTATAVFYWWTWKLRNPEPILIAACILGNISKPEELEFTVRVTLTNPGEVPIHVLSVDARVCDPGAGITSYRYADGEARGATTEPPHGVATLQSVVTLGAKCKEAAFPDGVERFWDVELDYVSGGRHRRGAFRRVVGVARRGSSWSSGEALDCLRESGIPTKWE